ncbi:MAG: alpha/beta hydrolase, partial [Pseudomonadota bacterium]
MKPLALNRRRLLMAGGAVAGLGLLATCAVEAPEPITPSGSFVEVDGVQVHYKIVGQGPRAIAIHGASGNLNDWAMGPVEALAETNQVLLLDRPGQGRTGRPDGAEDLFVQARLLRGAAARLGFGRAHLIGHSYGGSIALAWGLDAPESLTGLMVISAPSQVWEGGVGFIYDLIVTPVVGRIFTGLAPAIAGERTVENAVKNVFAPQSPPADYAGRLDTGLTLHPDALHANARDLTSLKANVRRMVPRYGELSMPVEILHGSADTVVPPDIHSDKLVQQIDGARYTRLEGIGHMPHHVSPDAIAK